MTTMTGNTVLMWWPKDIAILAIGIPHDEFITKYCPYARLEGIARLDGHKLVIRRPGDLAVGKVKKRPGASSTRTMAHPTEDTISTWSGTLAVQSLPEDLTTNDNNTYPTTHSPTVRPLTRRPSTPRQRSRSPPAPHPTQTPGAWPESTILPTPTPNHAPNAALSPAPIPSPDLNDSASVTTFGSSSTAVSDSQPQSQHVDNNHLHTQVWGLVYLLTATQYRRFQEKHLQPSTSLHRQPSTPQCQLQYRQDQHRQPQARQRDQPQLRLPRPFGIPMIFTRSKESQTPTRTLPEVQIHFFQQDLLRQSAARQHVFPDTAGDAVHRHLTEVEDIRLVRVLVRAGEDPDPVYDPVAEALYEAVNAGGDHGEGSSEGREQAEMAWRQQREHQRREELADGLASWFEDLRELGVPEPWLLKVMEGLVERLEGLHSGDEENEMEGLEFLRAQNVHNEEEDKRDFGDQFLDAVDNVARAAQGASRQVKGFARRGVEALVAQFAGKEREEREDEEWELVENPDRRGRRRRREGDGR